MIRPIRLAVALALAASVVVGCGDGSALGYASPPASFDPASPRLAAVDVAFDRSTVEVPAGKPFVLVFENQAALSHNVSIYADATLQRRVFEGVLFVGPATRWYPVPSLDPGSYVFICDLHPNMQGALEAR